MEKRVGVPKGESLFGIIETDKHNLIQKQYSHYITTES